MNPNDFLSGYSKKFYKGGMGGPMEGYRSSVQPKYYSDKSKDPYYIDNPQALYMSKEFSKPGGISGGHPGHYAYEKTAGKLRSFNTLEDAQRAAELFKGTFVQTDRPGSLDAKRVYQGPGGMASTYGIPYEGNKNSKKEKDYDLFATFAMRPHRISGTLKDPNIYAVQQMMEGGEIQGYQQPTAREAFGLDEAEEATKRYLGLQIGREKKARLQDRSLALYKRLQDKIGGIAARKDPRIVAMDERVKQIEERLGRKEKGMKRFVRQGAKERIARRGQVKGPYKDQIFGYIDVGGEYGGGRMEGDTEGSVHGLADAERKIRKSDVFQELLAQQKGKAPTEKQKARRKARAERDYSYLNPLNQAASGPTDLTGFSDERRATIGEIERRRSVLENLRSARKARELSKGYTEEETGTILDY